MVHGTFCFTAISTTPAATHRRPLKSWLLAACVSRLLSVCFLMAFWAFKTCVFVVLGPSKGALESLFGTLVVPGAAPGLWERTFGHFWLSFVTFGVPFLHLWGPLWPTLGAFGLLLGPLWKTLGVILDTLWRHFGHLKALFAYIG